MYVWKPIVLYDVFFSYRHYKQLREYIFFRSASFLRPEAGSKLFLVTIEKRKELKRHVCVFLILKSKPFLMGKSIRSKDKYLLGKVSL